MALEPGLTLGHLLRTLRRRAWVVALLGVLGGAAAYGYAKLAPDTYTAGGILAMESQRFTIPELQGATSGSQSPDPFPEVLTEVQVLTSPRMLQQVAATLHLENNPEFNSTLAAQTEPGFLRSLPFVPPEWIDRAAAEWTSFRAAIGLPIQPDQPPTPEAIQQAVLGELGKRLVVGHDSRSLIIDIRCTSQDPKVAAAVVNTLISVYEQARIDDHERINRSANASLMRRIDEIRAQVVALDEKVRAARASKDLPELQRSNVSEQQLTELISSATKSSFDRTQAAAVAGRAHTLMQGGSTDELAAVVGSGTISRLRDQEAQASRTVADLQSRYGDNYPGVAGAKANLQAVRGQIASEVRRTVASLDQAAQTAELQDRQIQAALAQARQTSLRVAGGQVEIRQLEEEATARRKLYESLLTRAEQTQTDPGQQMLTGARVVSNAFAPAFPSGPRRRMAAAIGLLGGLLAGSALALLGGRRSRRRFVDGGELASAIGLPVLATLPALGRLRPSAEAAGALRLLRSRIRFNGGVSPARTVVFVAAGGHADVAGTSIAFARTAAMDGERVLLIEGSITEPRLAARLGAEFPALAAARNGLEGLLTGALALHDAVVTDPVSGMDMLVVDRPSPALLGLVHGARFQMLLADAVQNYSFVIINAPTPQHSETLGLVHAADATIFVVGSGRIRSTNLQSSIASLAEGPYGFTAAVLAC